MNKIIENNKNKYTTIIFDLDDTLIDNIENIKYSFKTVLEYMNKIYSEEEFIKFYEIDKHFWSDHQKNKIIVPEEYLGNIETKRMWLRSQRFIIYFNEEINLDIASKISDIYTHNLKEKVVAIENSYMILSYLNRKYNIVVATNGPKEAAIEKLKKSNLIDFVSLVFTAEDIGFMKPKREFFEGLIRKMNYYETDKMLFVGDSIFSDIKGANEFNIDSCFFNINNEDIDRLEYKPKYIIHGLNELKEIL